ncbi:hypothetical protein VTO42DRAFT_3213 [Malbranchea cinnamomea]
MSKSRLPMWLGLGAVGAGGWYLYRAGGDPKKATQKFEDDASRTAHKIRGDMSGKPAAELGEEVGKRMGSKDEAVDTARDKAKQINKTAADYTKEGVERMEKVRQDAARDVNAKIDQIDETVEKKASEAKSGISSWFGGGKK